MTAAFDLGRTDELIKITVCTFEKRILFKIKSLTALYGEYRSEGDKYDTIKIAYRTAYNHLNHRSASWIAHPRLQQSRISIPGMRQVGIRA